MKKSRPLILAVTLFALAACSEQQTSTLPVSSSDAPKGISLVETKEALDVYRNRNQYGWEGISPSTGDVKMLVVPITFSDIAEKDPFTEADISLLTEAYKSETLDEKGLHSVEEFYSLSSYGKMNPEATIHDPVALEMTQDDFEANSIYRIIEELINKFQAAGEDLSPYDGDKDGYVDSLHLIYKTDRTLARDGGLECWWHMASGYDFGKIEGLGATPRFYVFADFDDGFDNGIYGEGVPDTHVAIHETGHLLGQDDLYNFNQEEAPAGYADMMDFDTGDHNPFTKMLYGWTDPYVLDGTENEVTITLRPYEESGDFVLLRNTSTDPWNETPYDEYLTLSYYTPTVLNERDSKGYPRRDNKGPYKDPGLQVFHVDARGYVAEEYNSDGAAIKAHYYEPGVDAPSDFGGVVTHNTAGWSLEIDENHDFQYSDFRYIEAISSDGIDHFATFDPEGDWFGNSKTLFGIGDAYGGKTYTNESMQAYFANGTSFNDGSVLDYSFDVMAMDESGLTVRFLRS